VNLNNVTIAGNTADSNMVTVPGGNGGGLFTSGAGVLIRNSIVAGNTDTGTEANDCSSSPGHTVTRQGYELIGDPLSCTFTGGDDATGYLTGSAGLGPLAPNGGTSQTMALQPGSQALGTGNPGTPDGGGIHCAAVDQRGQPRGGAAGTCDIGAYESQPVVLNPIGDKSATEGQNLSFTVSATDPDLLDTLTFAASSLPPGASFNPGTRTFSWTPTSADVGAHPGVHFSVSDGIFSDTEDIGITVVAASVTTPPGTTPPPAPPAAPVKKCKKHQKLKHGKCVKKKRKRK
jgi:hypothetical protein